MAKKSERALAFTLIETLGAMVILAIAIPPMLWAVRDAHVGRVDAILSSRARWLVTEKLEDVIADRHSTTRGYSYLVTGNYPAEFPVTGFANFDRSVAFTETGADLITFGSGYMNVTVSVTWNDAMGTARTMAISTVLTDYTP